MKIIAVFCVMVASVIAVPVKELNRKTEVASPHEIPYQIGLLSKTETGEYKIYCGGALISNKVILTAAHCLDKVLEAGLALRSQQNVTGFDLLVTKKDFIIHPEYNSVHETNDIGLIILPKEVVLNEYVNTVNLPHPDLLQAALVGKVATITANGVVRDNKGATVNNHLYAYMRILSSLACYSTDPNFQDTHICAFADNHLTDASCDVGGALVIPEPDGSSTIVGVAPYSGIDGCELGYETAFTRVTAYLDWIKENSGVVPKRY